MKHFFVVNPMAQKIRGRVNAVTDSIHAFFKEHPHMQYNVHVTRWERDAVGVVRRVAAEADGLLRVHVMGGSGTLFEVVNGIAGLPNAHIAAYPFGRENPFLYYFGADKLHLFSSIRSQVLSDTVPMDLFRGGNHYGIANGLIGMEAVANQKVVEAIDKKTILGDQATYLLTGLKTIFTQKLAGEDYRIDLDGENLDGNYVSIIIANGPCFNKKAYPAADAHPNDGILDFYIAREADRALLILERQNYLTGQHDKLNNAIVHYRGKKFTISADKEMTLCIDGQIFYEKSIEYEIIPGAIDFVCPSGIDILRLPRIYGRPETAPA
jgi:diacylglycerol kinase family enzyme